MTTKNRLVSLTEFVKQEGGQEHAAAKIGVSFVTIHRWLKALDKPRGLSRLRLKEVGVDPDKVSRRK